MSGPGGRENGIFSFVLSERVDRDGKMFLFAGLRFISAVLFIRPDEHGRWHAVLKPYVNSDEFDGSDDLPVETKPTERGKTK